MDGQDRTAAGYKRGSTLRLALRRAAMADEVVCGGGIDIDHDGRHVSAVARQVEDWGLVSQHGFPRTAGSVLRHGHLPPDTFLRDGFHGSARTVAVSEPV